MNDFLILIDMNLGNFHDFEGGSFGTFVGFGFLRIWSRLFDTLLRGIVVCFWLINWSERRVVF